MSFVILSSHLFPTEYGPGLRCRCFSSTVLILCLSWLWCSFSPISGLLSSSSVLLLLFIALPCWFSTSACSPCVVGLLERSSCAEWFSVFLQCVVALGQSWCWNVVRLIYNLRIFLAVEKDVGSLCAWLNFVCQGRQRVTCENREALR